MAEQGLPEGSVAESLRSLGLTKYESLVYIALIQASGATATELHELSGVPRASVYPVLERLSQKRLVSVSNTSPKRFSPVKPDEAIRHLLQSIESDAESAKTALHQMYTQSQRPGKGNQELIWSYHGDEQIQARLIELLKHARERVQIIFYWDHLRKEIIESLLSLQPTVQIQVITDQVTMSTGGRKFDVIKVPPVPNPEFPGCMAGGVFLIDGKQAMIVMGSKEDGFTALYSESTGFVRFFSMYWNFFSSWGSRQ